jgi:hypothetical protein
VKAERRFCEGRCLSSLRIERFGKAMLLLGNGAGRIVAFFPHSVWDSLGCEYGWVWYSAGVFPNSRRSTNFEDLKKGEELLTRFFVISVIDLCIHAAVEYRGQKAQALTEEGFVRPGGGRHRGCGCGRGEGCRQILREDWLRNLSLDM